MNRQLITNFLKSKGYVIIDGNKENIIAAFHVDKKLVISWIITDQFKGKHVVVIAFETTRDVRFNGKIANLQQANMILEAVN